MRFGHARIALLTLTALSASAAGSNLFGQAVKRSQKGSVSQTIAHTDITITYSRPVARGRTLFGIGGVVPYGREWCPGADDATRIELSRDITINGRELAAGAYSIWAIPREGDWTIIFSNAADVWHTPYPGAERDALRLDVTPEAGAHMETLAYYFPMVEANDAVLRLHWGDVIVPLSIRAP